LLANKKPRQIFIKYIGFIILITGILFTIWYFINGPEVFFEDFSCLSIVKLSLNHLAHKSLSETEHIRFHEMLQTCFDDKQFLKFEHEWGQ